MKKFTFKGVLDGFRSSVTQPVREDQTIIETLHQHHFQVVKTFRHGFPAQPTCVAFDPIQRLLALGTKTGSLRLLGRPGVDAHVRHEGEAAVLQIQFLTNEGALVTATADDSLHLWNFRQKKPEVVHTLKFQRERITYIHLPLQSKWLYVGTDRGNIHIVNIESFQLSGYVINWNKAIEPCRKTHPGPVVHLSDNPGDSSKLLIGFESGQLVLWDLRTRAAEIRWQAADALRGVAWHHEGKQFVCSHADGSLTTWQARTQTVKPVSITTPHAKLMKDGKLEACKPIQKVEWKSARISGEAYLIFSGGLPYDKAGRAPSITVIHGKTTTVLEMEHNVVDFITLCESPYVSDFQDPYAIVVLLQNDLVVIDLLTPGFPCFENPYPMDLHESPVTCCTYLADCPSDLIPAFYSVGSRSQKRSGFSEREWPVCGGEWSPTSCSYNEIIITGHADGSVKFWDASAGTLQVLYKLKTGKVFEKPRTRSTDGAGANDDDPFAVQLISLCPESRKLAIAGASSHVVLFKFRKQEATTETWKLEIPLSFDNLDEGECSPEYEYPPRSMQRGESSDGDARKNENSAALRVRTGPQKKPAGFQAYLVCVPALTSNENLTPITALCINSSYGLMAFGTESGVIVVDIVQRSCVLNMVTPDLYGSADPYQRVPRSPKRINESNSASDDRCRSPSTDQLSAEDSGSESGPKTPSTVHEVNSSVPLTPEEEKATTPTTDETDIPRKVALSWKALTLKRLRNTFTATNNAKETDIDSENCDSKSSSSRAVSPYDNDLAVPDVAVEVTESTTPTQSSEDTLEMDKLPIPAPRTKRKSPAITPVDPDDDLLICRPKDLPLLFDNNGKFLLQHPSRKKAVKDLRKQNVPQQSARLGGLMKKKLNKLDSSFSRSRSSSMSSLENISSEAVQCLAFADSYTKKSDPSPCPTLWVGTSLGSVLTVMINTPNTGASDARVTQPVVLTPCGTIFRLKGCILTMSFLDCNGALIPYSYEAWRDENREPRERGKGRGASMSPTTSASSSGGEQQCGDRQFVVLVSEKQARVVALPSQNCVYRQQLADTAFVVKAEIISLKDSVCLVCYLSSGQLSAYSLPSLRPLVYVDFLPLADLRIARTFCFSNRGHGLYLCSPTEVQKFTVSAEFCQSFSEMVGELFLTKEMPEPPKESFFRGLFGGGSRPLDREELFGEQSGRASKSVAKHITGQNLDALGARANTATSEVARAHQMMVERGEKLGVLEERSERMRNEAESFSTSAHSLMLKYKDKKWYQL